MESCSSNLKRITLELGGNDPAIVLPDVDIEETAKELFWAAFQNSAQFCVAAKRLYIHEDIYDALAAALVTRSEEHTSELQSLMRISYAVFCLKKKTAS